MKLGSKVRQVVTVVQGEVADVEWDKDKDQKRILVEWSSNDYETESRWFLENELEVIDGQ